MYVLAGQRASKNTKWEGRGGALVRVLRVSAQGRAQELPCVHHPQHARQTDPLRCVGQGPALPARVWQVFANQHENANVQTLAYSMMESCAAAV